MTDPRITQPCANCGNNGHWYEASPQYEGDSAVDVFCFIECPKCRFRTEAYADDVMAVDDWNAGLLIPPPEGK